jgi:hypothetical protein
MFESHTFSIAIGRPWKEVYEAIWRPEVFPTWASGLSKTSLERDGEVWKAEGPAGTVRIRFTDHNPYGVMDHYVDTGSGSVIYVPLRVVSNADGAEVLLTLFRQPEMSEEQFLADAESVRRDLIALKTLLAR